MNNSNENRVTLETNPDTTLYDWCLKQLDEHGHEIDLIPVGADEICYFRVTKSVIRNTIGFDYNSEENTEMDRKKISATVQDRVEPERSNQRSIHFELGSWSVDGRNPPRFLCVGSNQPITKIILIIRESQSPNVEFNAYSAPGESFDMDLDGIVWFEGFLQFDLFLPCDEYKSLIKSLPDNEKHNIVLNLKNIHGLYSRWRPPMHGADLEEIYILNRDDINEFSDDVQIAPTIGHVGSFTITTLTDIEYETPTETELNRDVSDSKRLFEESKLRNLELIATQLTETVNHLRSLLETTERHTDSILKKLDYNLEESRKDLRDKSDISHENLASKELLNRLYNLDSTLRKLLPSKVWLGIVITLLAISSFF